MNKVLDEAVLEDRPVDPSVLAGSLRAERCDQRWFVLAQSREEANKTQCWT